MSTSIRDNWVPNRRGIIIEDMRQAGLYRSDTAPVFNLSPGPVSANTPLSMTAPGGVIYYTTDGTDPRSPLVPDPGGPAGNTKTLVAENSPKRVIVPADDSFGATWTGGNEPFNDGAWSLGTGGVGYDEQRTYDSLINIDVEGEMNNQNASCYIRIPFTVTASDIEEINSLQLRVRFDDGFVAYLNGIRITSSNAPATLAWNSPAEGANPDSSAVELLSFNVSDFIGELKSAGNNILAIHGLNYGLTSSDFLHSVMLEGSDTVVTPTETSPSAIRYEGSFRITQSQQIKARTLQNDGEWSALTEAVFLSEPDVPTLRFSEIMYNPDGPNSLEFVELENFGTLPVDLTQMELRGITFTFPDDAILAPGGRLVLASNDDLEAFAARYPGTVVYGTFTGNLSNGGETLTLEDGIGNTITSVRYDDEEGWAPSADGEGHSLVLTNPDSDPHSPANWSASSDINGSPGESDPASPLPAIIISEVLADNRNALPHGGEFPAFIELRNPRPTPVSLDGWSLSDDGATLGKFPFPPGAQIDGNGDLVI
ncbi:MAG: lamin tail domain-containing protein, partial [Verrucomicrobiota bacterium]|nr:lamin tail domain-containing protein [Verrucomicrobiota bacterium]